MTPSPKPCACPTLTESHHREEVPDSPFRPGRIIVIPADPLRARVAALLRKIESDVCVCPNGCGTFEQCPSCRWREDARLHSPDCELAALLREVESG